MQSDKFYTQINVGRLITWSVWSLVTFGFSIIGLYACFMKFKIQYLLTELIVIGIFIYFFAELHPFFSYRKKVVELTKDNDVFIIDIYEAKPPVRNCRRKFDMTTIADFEVFIYQQKIRKDVAVKIKYNDGKEEEYCLLDETDSLSQQDIGRMIEFINTNWIRLKN